MRRFSDFLTSKNVALVNHASSYLLNILACTIYEEGEEREAALSCIHSYQDHMSHAFPSTPSAPAEPSQQSAHPTNGPPHGPHASDDKVSHYISMRFRDENKKFSGALGEC